MSLNQTRHTLATLATVLAFVGGVSAAARAQTARDAAATPIPTGAVDGVKSHVFRQIAPKWAVLPEQRNAALFYLSADLSNVDARAFTFVDVDAAGKDGLGDSLDPKNQPKEWANTPPLDSGLESRIVAAANLARCDFEIEYERGYKAAVPGLQNMRTAARLLRLGTRVALMELEREGNHERAATNIAAMFRIARHAADQRTVISSLVARRIMEMAFRETRLLLTTSAATHASGETIRAAIDEFGPDPLRRFAALDTEEAAIVKFFADHAAAKEPGASLAAALTEFGAPADGPAAKNARTATRADVLASRDRARAFFESVRAEWNRPGADRRAGFVDAQVLAMKNEDPLKTLLPALDSMGQHCTTGEEGLATLAKDLKTRLTRPEPQPTKNTGDE